MQVFTGRNRAKYDMTQHSSRWAIQRDQALEQYNIQLVEAALGCCKSTEPKQACTCTSTRAADEAEPFTPLGILPEDDGFDMYRQPLEHAQLK